jgi:hypothetical protein
MPSQAFLFNEAQDRFLSWTNQRLSQKDPTFTQTQHSSSVLFVFSLRQASHATKQVCACFEFLDHAMYFWDVYCCMIRQDFFKKELSENENL